MLPKGLQRGEVPNGEVVLLLHLQKGLLQPAHQLLLLGLLAEHGGHRLPERAQDQAVDLQRPHPLDELADLPRGVGLRNLVQVLDQVLPLPVHEVRELGVRVVRVKEVSGVNPGHLWGPEDSAQGPHQRTVNLHEVLGVDLVRLVQDDPDLVIKAVEGLDDAFELVRDVELVGVEEQQDEVRPLREPPDDLGELVTPLQPLLLPRQHARGVHNVDGVEQLRWHLRPGELVQKLLAKLGQPGVGLIRGHGERVARHCLGGVRMRDHDEPVRGRLRTDDRGGVLLPEEVLDEGRLSDAVLAEHHHRRLGGEVLGSHAGRVEERKLKLLLERPEVLEVELAQSVLQAVHVLDGHLRPRRGGHPEHGLLRGLGG
mmetsp:Transcript_8260/g.28358  ORF Transcript_8260/g.28358 Transcript_8260/m.28358 type:complete len:370 (-) Transcript_8260:541-1650(-)